MIKWNKTYCTILLFSFLIHRASFTSKIVADYYNSFDEMMKVVDIDVIALRDIIELAYIDRCKIRDFNLKNCSYLSCSSNYPIFTCNQNFVLTNSCNCYDKSAGIKLNLDKSGIRLANIYSPFTDPNDQGVKEMIASTSSLDQKFQELMITKKFYKWLYFGSLNGVFRTYPLAIKCDAFDNRIRPWYVGAVSGTKNMILILDFSGSMTGTRISTLRQSIALLINTLNSSDWIGIVVFSTVASYYQDKLIRATYQNKIQLIDYVNKITPDGGTNFSDAFQMADYLLSNSLKQIDSPCKNLVIFITDGKPSDGITELEPLLQFIDDLPNLKNVTIFAYAVGLIMDTVFPERISCLRGGLFEYIEDENYAKRLTSYFTSLSHHVELKKPIWIEPYVDTGGLGLMTSSAIPVYDRSGTEPFLIGVVAIDLLINDLLQFESLDSLHAKILNQNIFQCVELSFSICQVNSLRSPYFQCEEKHTNSQNNSGNSSQVSNVNSTDCIIRSQETVCPNSYNFPVFCETTVQQTKSQFEFCCGSKNVTCAKSSYIKYIYTYLIFVTFILFLIT